MRYDYVALTLSFVWSAFFLPTSGLAQGCSDAGFCTMGAMKPDQPFNKKINFKLRSIEVSYYRGQSTLTPVITVANIDASIGVTNNLGVQIKIPYQWTDGNFGKTSSLGDLSFSATQRLLDKEKFDLNASIGFKVPTNSSDIKSSGARHPLSEGKVLPMYYQTSLGSYDIIAGGSLISSKWLLATGIQAALTANNNTFKWGDWNPPVYPNQEYVQEYDRATKLKRGADVMLRVERNFRFSNFSFNIGALAIYRITKDQIQDLNTAEYVKLDNTTGLAFTLLNSFTYQFDTSNSLKIAYGHKITDREVNPDGLTRKNVLIIAYGFRF